MTPKVYTVDQVAELLGVGRDTVYRQIKRDQQIAGITPIRVSGRMVIPAARLNAVLGIETTDERRTA